MNNVNLMGRLVRDIELKYTNSQTPVAVANFTLAVNRRFKRDGEPDADFFDCVAFGRTAETMDKFLSNGRQIALTGRLQVRTWEDKEGKKRKTVEVIVESFDFCGKREDAEVKQPTQQDSAETTGGFYPISDDDDDDLPF